MIKCDGCGLERQNWFFKEVGENYNHLGLKKICLLCRVKPKTCSLCNTVKPGNTLWFYPHKTGKYKVMSYCRKCHSKRMYQKKA